VGRLKSLASAVRRNYERVASRFETGVQMLEHRYTRSAASRLAFEGVLPLAAAALGFLAMVLILSGSSFTNSPFKFNYPHLVLRRTRVGRRGRDERDQVPALDRARLRGLLLLMRVWLRLAEVMKLHPGASLKSLWWMLLLWASPMIIAPPLFSRDVFSYAAQGEMTSHAISPYLYGPFSLGAGPYVAPVDPLWGNTPAPTDHSSCSLTARSTRSRDTTNSRPSSDCDCSRWRPWR